MQDETINLSPEEIDSGTTDLGTERLEPVQNSSTTVETKRKVAAENGKFYNSIIDAYLESKTPEEQKEQTAKLVETLPGPMRKLYGEGLSRFQEELAENHALLEQHRGEEVQYLLSAVMRSDGKNDQEIQQVLEHTDKTRFVEPSPGVAVIQAERDFFRLLKEYGIVHTDGHAAHFGSDNRGEPSFMMVQRMSLETSLAEDTSQTKENRSVIHEFHHFIWNFLERRGDFLREVNENTPELSEAFRHFRNEIAAYIVEGRNPSSVETDLLAYTNDADISKMAADARDFSALCIEVAKQKGFDPQTFLYASMSSRNFAELKDGFTTLTPLDKVDQESIAALYSAWSSNYRASTKVAELLERKKVTIPPNLVEEYGLGRMVSPNLTSMGGIFSELESLKRFANVVNIDSIDERVLIEKIARARLPLPKETVEAIITLPREQAKDIPLGKPGEEFLESFVSFWNIDQESARAVYKLVINSSPVMRAAFEKVKGTINENGAKSYRDEFKASESRKQQTESEIQERTRLLMEL